MPRTANNKVDGPKTTKLVALQWEQYSEEERAPFKEAAEELHRQWEHMR